MMGQTVTFSGHWVCVAEHVVAVPVGQIVCVPVHCVAAVAEHCVAVPIAVGQTVNCRGH